MPWRPTALGLLPKEVTSKAASSATRRWVEDEGQWRSYKKTGYSDYPIPSMETITGDLSGLMAIVFRRFPPMTREEPNCASARRVVS